MSDSGLLPPKDESGPPPLLADLAGNGNANNRRKRVSQSPTDGAAQKRRQVEGMTDQSSSEAEKSMGNAEHSNAFVVQQNVNQSHDMSVSVPDSMSFSRNNSSSSYNAPSMQQPQSVSVSQVLSNRVWPEGNRPSFSQPPFRFEQQQSGSNTGTASLHNVTISSPSPSSVPSALLLSSLPHPHYQAGPSSSSSSPSSSSSSSSLLLSRPSTLMQSTQDPLFSVRAQQDQKIGDVLIMQVSESKRPQVAAWLKEQLIYDELMSTMFMHSRPEDYSEMFKKCELLVCDVIKIRKFLADGLKSMNEVQSSNRRHNSTNSKDPNRKRTVNVYTCKDILLAVTSEELQRQIPSSTWYDKRKLLPLIKMVSPQYVDSVEANEKKLKAHLMHVEKVDISFFNHS